MKKTTFKMTVAALAVLTISVVALVISCATIDRVVVVPPMIPGAKYVGMDTCALCHEKHVKDFKFTAHARITIAGDQERVGAQGCEACHGPGSLHVDAEGKGFIVNPVKNPDACFACHLDKNAEFSLPSHHPVKEGRMTCTACHDPHGRDIKLAKGMFIGRQNDACAQCHREQAGPHVFEHEALREGCETCHNVHGSINAKMLKERDSNLCLKCHAQIASPSLATGTLYVGQKNHTALLSQGTCFSAGCHTASHGSNINPLLRY